MPGSNLSIWDPPKPPGTGTAPAGRPAGPHEELQGGASGLAGAQWLGAWWPGLSRHPDMPWREAALGTLVVHNAPSRSGVTRTSRSTRPHDVNPQGSALLCRLPRVTRATAAGGALIAWLRPAM